MDRRQTDCWHCGGTGAVICPDCQGQGSRTELNYGAIFMLGFPAEETIICDSCKGEGTKECVICDGTGKINSE